MNIQINEDFESYKVYSDLISSTYPAFLQKYGINNTALKAEGSIIYDSHGNEYIDCIGGYGIFNIGHNHPKILKDMTDILNSKQLFTKPFISKIQIEAAEKISMISPDGLNCSFLCNSGSEAVDNAIKLARLYNGKTGIITAVNSFHGYTFGGLSATGINSFKKFFKPLVPDIVQVPFGDIESLEKTITNDTSAIMLEPIQHEAGVNVPPENYLKHVREICNENNILLILDEIKTGMGKTGSMFACDDLDVVPDILVIGKSLGGGIMPIGALVSSKKLWRRFSLSFPMSASSFAGNVLACQAVSSTIDIINHENLVSSCKRKGIFFHEQLEIIVGKYPSILKKVSGKGLLFGVKTVDSATSFKISKEIIKRGVLMFQAYGNPETIMIEPPIVIAMEQIQKVIKELDNVCCEMVN